jgi:isopenicillin-N epimerase
LIADDNSAQRVFSAPLRLCASLLNMRDQFLLEDNVIFLNHGSFGACPRPVLAAYQAWQRQLEAQPVRFLGREVWAHLADARRVLGDYLNSTADNLVFVPNATFGVNVVARSLALGPGDEVLATDHEYGACDRTWQFLAQKHGFTYLRQPVPLDRMTAVDLLEAVWADVTPRTKLLFVSHISSATAVTFPVAALCARAREAGILTLIDGAHAPGQIDLDLTAVDADFYTGNCHKWLCAPKGAAFLYARPSVQSLIEPLVVSWGWGDGRQFTSGSDFVDYLGWQGTADPSAYLSVPDAIRFQAGHNWPVQQQRCHEMLCRALLDLEAITGCISPYPDQFAYRQMAIAPLPPLTDTVRLKERLYNDYRIEIPCIEWNGRQFVRISVQAYNTVGDLDQLSAALYDLLPLLKA